MFEIIQFLAFWAIWFLCPILIVLVLIQGGGSDMGSAFGGGSQLDSALGVGAVRKISKITAWLVITFMACVIIVAMKDRGQDLAQFGGQAGDEAEVGEAMGPLVEDDEEAPLPPVDGTMPPLDEVIAQEERAADPSTDAEAVESEPTESVESEPTEAVVPESAVEEPPVESVVQPAE